MAALTASGSTDAEGQPGKGDPIADVAWVRAELHGALPRSHLSVNAARSAALTRAPVAAPQRGCSATFAPSGAACVSAPCRATRARTRTRRWPACARC